MRSCTRKPIEGVTTRRQSCLPRWTAVLFTRMHASSAHARTHARMHAHSNSRFQTHAECDATQKRAPTRTHFRSSARGCASNAKGLCRTFSRAAKARMTRSTHARSTHARSTLTAPAKKNTASSLECSLSAVTSSAVRPEASRAPTSAESSSSCALFVVEIGVAVGGGGGCYQYLRRTQNRQTGSQTDGRTEVQ